MKKKKPKGAEDGKDAKDDEQGLVDGEQVEAEEVRKYFLSHTSHFSGCCFENCFYF